MYFTYNRMWNPRLRTIWGQTIFCVTKSLTRSKMDEKEADKMGTLK